jgi:transcription initiation factor IIE alpha subunit
MNSPKQQEIIDLLQTRVNMTAAEIAAEVGSETKATSKHLRLLEDMGQIYVCEWRKGKHNVLTKAYRLGDGESVVLVGKKQDAARRALTKRKEYDPYAPIAPNNGWRSMIHSKDYSFQHGEHIKFMERFHPRPDVASAWLFNKPRVELLGAKYE